MAEQSNRRTFLKKAAGSMAVAGIVGTEHFILPSNSHAQEKKSLDPSEMIAYRTLGRTGLKYTTLGFGAMRTSDPAVIRKAVDMGVNNIDTARGYMDGINEEIVGKAIKDIRDQLHITTKIKVSNKKSLLKDAEASLKAIGTDYVDILLLHSMKSEQDIDNDDAKEVLEKLKKEGKIRFAGFSTHRNMAKIIQASLKDKFFDVILTAYNFKADDDLKKAIAKASKANIGIIAMKTQAGGYESDKMGDFNAHQAALKWVLSDENVTCAIPSMVTFDHVNENFKVMNSQMGWMDRKTLYRYGHIIDKDLCRMCGECTGQCPFGVSVADINRCIMYNDAYKDINLAKENYRQLSITENISQCTNCDICTVQCHHGLNIAAKMNRAVELFA